MNEMTLSGKKQVVSLKLEGQSGARTRDFQFSKQAALTTAPGLLPYKLCAFHKSSRPIMLPVVTQTVIICVRFLIQYLASTADGGLTLTLYRSIGSSS